MTQYYQLTLQDALTQYKAGFLSSAGLLFNYLKIKFAPGWKMHINQPAICDELGLSRDQFYRGLKSIKQHFPNLKLHRTTALVGEFEVSNTSSDDKNPVDEPVVETATPVVETATPVVETATNTSPKPLKINQDSDSPDSSSNSYQIFLSSLSDSQREKFFEFCTNQANQLPKPPILIKKWIQHNWSELRSLWCKKCPDVVYENGNVIQNDWYKHPRFNRWKLQLESPYQAPYFITLLKNGGTEEERRAFARWAIDNEIIKLPEGVTINGL